MRGQKIPNGSRTQRQGSKMVLRHDNKGRNLIVAEEITSLNWSVGAKNQAMR
jgi:hypothetical protein